MKQAEIVNLAQMLKTQILEYVEENKEKGIRKENREFNKSLLSLTYDLSNLKKAQNDVYSNLEKLGKPINIDIIFEACETGDIGIMELLIELNTDLNIQEYKSYPGFSLLHVATCYSQAYICKLLLKSGVSIKVKDNFGRTALHWACHFGLFDIVKILVDNSIINTTDHDGNTPLWLAANAGHEKIVSFLIGNHAYIKNHNGQAPYLNRNYSDQNVNNGNVVSYIHNTRTLADGTVIEKCTLLFNKDSLYKGQVVNGKIEGRGVLICALGKYEGEFKGGEMHGAGKLTMASGHIYEGDFINSEMCGRGKYIWASGTKYEGEFVDGEIHGTGTLTRRDGQYDGEFINGEICGKGKHVKSYCNVYIGEWKDGARHGYGTQTYSDGTYEGDWVYGRREGLGKFIYDVSQISKTNDNPLVLEEGEYKNDMMSGKGKRITINGDIYEGEIVNLRAQGIGKLIWKDGAIYEGNFVDDKYEGQGKLVFCNGDSYEGSFQDGKIVGNGKMIFLNSGDIYEGNVITDHGNAVMHGNGRVTWNDGRVYEGTFVNGKRTGQGKLMWPNGDIYEGSFVDNYIVGIGIYTYPSGAKYIGNHVIDNIREGEGVFYFPDGRVKAGYFKDNIFIKPFL